MNPRVRLSLIRTASLIGAAILTIALASSVPAGASSVGAAAVGAAAVGASPAKSTVGPRADFNGDGFGDLAIGVPGEGIGSKSNAGGVNVLYGTASGVAATGNQFWSQDSPGVVGVAAANDGFGSATAVGDFNHDGFSDLAVGVAYTTVNGHATAGGVTVLYGSDQGLTSTGSQLWTQDSPKIRNKANAGDEFGFSLAAGDFDGDGSPTSPSGSRASRGWDSRTSARSVRSTDRRTA